MTDLQLDQERKLLFDHMSLEALSILKDLTATKFESITAVHSWLDNLIAIAEKANDYSRAIAANAVMLALGKQLDANKCDLTCLSQNTQDELLTMLGMP